MSEIESLDSNTRESLTDQLTLRLSLRPASSPKLQRNFAIGVIAITMVAFIITLARDLLIEDFLGVISMGPVIIAAYFRRQRLAAALAVWSIIICILLLMSHFTYGYSFGNVIIIINIIALGIQIAASFLAYMIYTPSMENEPRVLEYFETKLNEVKGRVIKSYSFNVDALRISDRIGVSKLFSVRNFSLLLCLFPFL